MDSTTSPIEFFVCPAGDDVGQLIQLGRRRFAHPLKAKAGAVGQYFLDPIQEQHVKVDVEIRC